MTTDPVAFTRQFVFRGYFSSNKYRFGFNGKEMDNEVKGDGNWQDYGARFFDTRLCRFPSPDPIIINEHKYPELSPYQFASLNPIQNIDLDGLEGVQSLNQFNNLQASGKSFLKVVNAIPEPVKRGAYGTFQVVSGFGTCVGGVAIGVGTLGCATPLGIGVFVVGSSSVVAGVRTLANLADGGSKEDDPKYGNIAGEIFQSETVDNLVGLGTSFAPTPNTFFNVVNWANRADNTKNLVQIAANKESSTQASPTSTATNSTTSGVKTNTKHGNEAKESGKFVKREQKSYKQTTELSHF